MVIYRAHTHTARLLRKRPAAEFIFLRLLYDVICQLISCLQFLVRQRIMNARTQTSTTIGLGTNYFKSQIAHIKFVIRASVNNFCLALKKVVLNYENLVFYYRWHLTGCPTCLWMRNWGTNEIQRVRCWKGGRAGRQRSLRWWCPRRPATPSALRGRSFVTGGENCGQN